MTSCKPKEALQNTVKEISAGSDDCQGKLEATSGALDASVGTMAYWLVTGDEDGDFLRLKEMLGSSWK